MPVLVRQEADGCSPAFRETILHAAEHGAELVQTENQLLRVAEAELRKADEEVHVSHTPAARNWAHSSSDQALVPGPAAATVLQISQTRRCKMMNIYIWRRVEEEEGR